MIGRPFSAASAAFRRDRLPEKRVPSAGRWSVRIVGIQWLNLSLGKPYLRHE